MRSQRLAVLNRFVRYVLLILALEVSFQEFLELQYLDAGTLRTRFHLPKSCWPRLSAALADPAAERVHIFISCAPPPASPVPLPATHLRDEE